MAKPMNMNKLVCFQPNNVIHFTSSLIHVNDEELWYGKEQLNEFCTQVKLALLAVNDTCGDINPASDVESCVQAVLKQQANIDNSEVFLSKISQEKSMSSTITARLYAQVLEKDVYQGEPVTYETLLQLVNDTCRNVEESFIFPNNDDDDECDNDSMGTIDEMPNTGEDQNSSAVIVWDEAYIDKPNVEQTLQDCDKKAKDSNCIPRKSNLKRPRDSSQTVSSEVSVSVDDSKRHVRSKVLSYDDDDDLENRCKVAESLIALAKWEFRGCEFKAL